MSNWYFEMQKLFGHGSEGENQRQKVVFGPVKKVFGIPKMKLHFQNIDLELVLFM